MKRPLLAGLAILIAWMLLDLLMHRLFLAPLYDASKELWRLGVSAGLGTFIHMPIPPAVAWGWFSVVG